MKNTDGLTIDIISNVINALPTILHSLETLKRVSIRGGNYMARSLEDRGGMCSEQMQIYSIVLLKLYFTRLKLESV